MDRNRVEPQSKEALLHIKDEILEAIFANIHFLVAYLDRDFNFAKVNKAYADLYGQYPDSFVGKNYFELYPHKENQKIFEMAVDTGRPYHAFAKPFQSDEQARSGVTYWDWSLLPIKDPQEKVTGLILTLVDVTDRKEAEERINGYILELERSNQELEEFAYVASHDLQEPLRKIQTFGELLKTQLAETLPPDAADSLNRMVTAAARMRTLIRSLLTYSRVTTKARPFQTVDMEAVTREALSNLETVIEQKQAHIDIGPLPVVEADPDQMLQLMQNLVLNSLKFQKQGNIPHVRIWAPTIGTSGGPTPTSTEPPLPVLCEIRVQDNGIGFDERHLDRIFIAFQRLHGRSAYEGVGIGLAICRKIVDRHGGEITAKSTPNRGSTFVVRLPLKQENQ
jgi:PAS domain S-box-containing protein